MTAQRLPGASMMAWPLPYFGTAFSTTMAAMTASGHQIAAFGCVCIADGSASKTLQKVHFMAGTTVSAGGSNLVVDIQSRGTAGTYAADGVSLAGGGVSAALSTYTASAWNTTGALTTPPTVNDGDHIAVVFSFTSYGGSDAFNLAAIAQGSGSQHLTPLSTYNGSAWATNGNLAAVMLEFSDGTFGQLTPHQPFTSLVTDSFDNADTPDEVGLRFQFPFPVRVRGAWFHIVINNAGDDFDVVLYQDTTQLAAVSIDGNWRQATNVGSVLNIMFESPQSLSANTDYIIAIKPTQATQPVGVLSMTVDDAAHLAAVMGTNQCKATRTDAGAWSFTTTQWVRCGLFIDKFDDGAGGGGFARGRILAGM